MTMYRVTIERSSSAEMWVEADTKDEAIEAAGELADSSFFDFPEDDIWATEGEKPEGEFHWTGGPNGDWSDA